MNVKKFLLASLAVFITFQVFDFLIHGLALAGIYEEHAEIWRADMSRYMWIMYIVSVFLSLLFVYIFTKSCHWKGITGGARYGLLIGLLMSVVAIMNQYVVYPIPFNMALIWMVGGLIEFIIAGIVAAAIYKPKQATN